MTVGKMNACLTHVIHFHGAPITTAFFRRFLFPRCISLMASPSPKSNSNTAMSCSRGFFTWDDVFHVASDDWATKVGANDGQICYSQRVQSCSRGLELQSEFLPFLVEGGVVGYIHNRFVEHLSKFEDVFVIMQDKNMDHLNSCVTLHPSLMTSEDRTSAIGNVIRCLKGLIPGIRNELYPVTLSFGMPTYFSLERAAAPYFGIKAYGVHMNGYVEKRGQKFLWVGKRSHTKSTYPGMLDHLVAGGMPHGISCKENIIKECKEEAGIPASISDRAIPVGAVSYIDIEGPRYKRDVLFCYDLKLPEDFLPVNEDGEVESFKLMSMAQVANVIRRTEFFKQNCNLVIIDFLFRHGYMNPDEPGYLELLQSLRSGDCS